MKLNNNIKYLILPTQVTTSINKKNTTLKIAVFNWNICWECITNASKNYGVICKKTKNCFRNIKKTINNIYTDYDFITLQEATNYKELLLDIPYTHTYYKHKVNKEDMITIYNKKFIFINSIKSEIRERPILSLLFSININSKIHYIIVINIHNAHHVPKLEIQQNLNNVILFYELLNVNKNLIHIILAGDFNDKRFEYKNFKLLQFKLTTQYIPPNSCCAFVNKDGTNNTSFSYMGDYILSYNLREIKGNKLYKYIDRNIPTSDHLPVYSIFSIE